MLCLYLPFVYRIDMTRNGLNDRRFEEENDDKENICDTRVTEVTNIGVIHYSLTQTAKLRHRNIDSTYMNVLQ